MQRLFRVGEVALSKLKSSTSPTIYQWMEKEQKTPHIFIVSGVNQKHEEI